MKELKRKEKGPSGTFIFSIGRMLLKNNIYVLIYLNRQLSCLTGRPIMLHDDEIDVDWPTNVVCVCTTRNHIEDEANNSRMGFLLLSGFVLTLNSLKSWGRWLAVSTTKTHR